MTPPERPWRTWNLWFTATAATLLALTVALQVEIDPYGVWGTQALEGLTNAKVAQPTTLRMFKPYQFLDAEPRVVFLGSSRINQGLPASWPGMPDSDVFNFGIDAGGPPEILQTLDFVLRTHPPEVLVVGVDYWMVPYPRSGPGDLSQAQLDGLSASSWTAMIWRLRDTVLSIDAIDASRKTVEASQAAPKEGSAFERGSYDAPPRNRTSRSWASGLFRKILRYQKIRHRARWLPELKQALQRARDLGVTVVVIIPAAHPDLLIGLKHARPRGLQELEAFKRSVVTQLGPTWDFFNAAPALQKRADFSDASHADDALGRRMLATMTRTGPPVGMLLTVDTIDAQLIQQQAWYQGFKTREKRMSTLIASKEKWAEADEEAFQAQVRKFVRR